MKSRLTHPSPERSGYSWTRSLVSVVCSLLLALGTVVGVVPPAPAQAASAITLDKTAAGSVLVGGEVEYHLAAGNPADSGVEQYNLSYTDVLPVGVAYVPGSSSPTGFGEPEVMTITDDATATPPVTHQVLTWSNVSDLTPGAVRTLTFRAATDAAKYPVGSSVANTASAYSSSDPYEVPGFDNTGTPVAGSHVVSATDTASTAVSAIKITKSEPSLESELIRGVNDHQTVYSLKVTNNTIGATSGLVVVDYLPAGLEFLGCGGDFNSSAPEYPGATNEVAAVAKCDAPSQVETVLNPAGYPAGVYTKVTWTLSDLASGVTHTINYAAGIPQRENTMTWQGSTPSSVSGEQAANLDNNTGSSTRETAGEATLENFAVVTGTFQGKPVTDSANASVTAEDLKLVKSVSPTRFAQNGIATYSLDVDVSEYVDASALTITDVLPDGLCPLKVADPSYVPPADCPASLGAAPTNGTITGVVANADGTFTLTLTPSATALTANGHMVITYQALMRPNYGSGKGATSARDDFTNAAHISGTTLPKAGVDSPDVGVVSVGDDSSATISSGGPQLTKLRMANAATMNCSTSTSDYGTSFTGEEPFVEGDRVCFVLRLEFPAGVATRGAQLTDFLPTNLTYESSEVLSGAGLVSSIQPASPTNYVTWMLGTGSPLVVPPGSVFEVALSAIVTNPAAVSNPAQALDKENLAKFRFTNTAGQSESLRDAVSLPIGPPPPIGITKGVQSVSTTTIDDATTPANVDGSWVNGADTVTFRIDLQNLATATAVNSETIFAPDVWDVLPAGITCSAVSAISNGGVCYDAGEGGRPALKSGDTTSSVIRWQLPSSFTLDPQQYAKLTYAIKVPTTVSVSTRYNNLAAVASYTTSTNLSDPAKKYATHNPASNISAAVPAAQEDVPVASDTSYVVVHDAVAAKSNLTSITETGNSASQAVVGELVTYTVSVKIPPHTSVYNGVLSDPMPTGLTYIGPATALFSASGTSPATAPLPAGVSLTSPVTAGTLSFGTTYRNDSDTDQLFEVKIPARLGTDATNIHGVVRTNTASFTSDTLATGGTAIPPRTATSRVTVVAPSPTLAKAASPATVAGGDLVTYTLTAANASGRPPLHDSWVVDCLPGALAFVAFTQTPSGTSATTEAGTGTNGCATGTTRIAWKISDLAGSASLALKYTATVTANPAGGEVYTNTAALTGSTLKDGKTDPTGSDNSTERTYSVPVSRAVTVSGATVNKTATPSALAPGQIGSYTVTATLPANVAFYDSAVMDALPTQMTFGSTTSLSCTNADLSDCTTGIPGTLLGPTSSVVGWVIGDLPVSNQVRTITIVYTAKMNAAGNAAGNSRTNTAHFRWNRADGNNPTTASTSWGSNGASKAAAVTVIEPTMSIAKAVNGGATASAAPGDVLSYQVRATNASGATSAPAYNLTVSDVVPAGVIVDPASLVASGGSLTGTSPGGSGGVITWTIPGPLSPGASLTFTYTGELAASGTLHNGDVETNTATVGHYESQPAGGKTTYPAVSSSASVTTLFPHVSAAKTVAAGPSYLGKPKSWTITVTNDGTAAAQHASAVDAMPMNWIYDVGSAGVVVNGAPATALEPALGVDGAGHQVLTWADLGTIPVGRTAVITFTATPKDPDAITNPGVGSAVNHTNAVSALAQDATGATGNATGSYGGPSATATTHIDSADVQIVKTSGDAVAGSNLTYTLAVTNNGGDPAVGPFTVTDHLPTGLDSATASGSGWSCSVDTTTITCARTAANATLASGASFPDITVVALVPANAAAGVTLVNSASVSASTYDPVPANNTSEVTDTVARVSDLGIKKEASDPTLAGDPLTYMLNVTNYGPSDSDGPIVVADHLPADTTYVSAAGVGWACADAGQEVTCTRSAGLTAGSAAPQITVVVKVAASATGSLKNSADVKGPNPDPVSLNDSDTVTTTVQTSADLSLEKAHQGGFVAGGEGRYQLTVVNHGPSVAAGPIKITDQLAPELTFLSDDSDSWDCSANAVNLLTCTNSGDMAVGDTATFTMRVAVDSAHTGSVDNAATVSSATQDPHLSNNTDGDSTAVDVESDLSIDKSHRGDVTAGENLDFTLDVTNHGRSDSPGEIVVSDTLPAGMSLVSATGTGWSCSATGAVVTCTHSAGLAAGKSAEPITVTVKVASDAGPATLTNIANVSGPAPDPKPANNTDHDPATVVDEANVSIVKTASAKEVVAGTEVSYSLKIHDDGPSDADNVVVVDPLPAGLTLVEVDAPTGWACSDTTPVSCHRATLTAGSSSTITVTARVGAGVVDGTKISNTSTVSTATPGDDSSDNTDTATIQVTTEADLWIKKSHREDDVVAGGMVTFDLAVGNDGPSDAAAEVVVTDTLPVGMTFVASEGSSWTCAAAEADASGQVVTCKLADGSSIAATTQAPPLALVVQVDSDVDPSALVDSELVNRAVLSSPTTDPKLSNNDATDPVKIGARADLQIVKSHDAPARVGDSLDFAVVVTNVGPSVARRVVVSDKLPEGLKFGSATGDGWACEAVEQLVTCAADDPLGVGESAALITVRVSVLASAYPTVTNTAVVTSATPDPEPGNNSSVDPVAVPAKVDLEISKHHSGDALQVGDEATYTLGVVNHGPTDDPGPITVTDSLPSGLSFVHATGDRWQCAAASNTVTCTREAGLAKGDTTSVTLVVDVGAAAYPSVTNVATIQTASEDTDPNDNLATDPAPVKPLYHLSLVKTLVSLSASDARWLIRVTNTGPNEAPSGAVVTDELPRQLRYGGVIGEGWSCAVLGQLVTCSHPEPIPPGATAEFALNTVVVPGSTGEITNSATVEGGDSSSATGTIPRADDALAFTGGLAMEAAILGICLLVTGFVLVRRVQALP